MMRAILMVTFVLRGLMSFGQDGNYNLNFDEPFYLDHLSIDTNSNPDNVWQIGKPQKNILSSAKSIPNALITDTVNPYPSNDTSIFVIKNSTSFGFHMGHTAVLSGYYSVNADSANDFGLIEFSPDNGITWIDLLNDTVYSSYYQWISPKPTLTGNSNGWQQFYVRLSDLGPLFNINWYGDTVLYKFTFISDSNADSLDGLMYDDLHFEDRAMGIDELSLNYIKSRVLPNPATNDFSIEFNNPFFSSFSLIVYDNSGKFLFTRAGIIEDYIKIPAEHFSSGVYYYTLTSLEDKKRALGKIVIEK